MLLVIARIIIYFSVSQFSMSAVPCHANRLRNAILRIVELCPPRSSHQVSLDVHFPRQRTNFLKTRTIFGFQELFGRQGVQGKNQRFRYRQRNVLGRLLPTGRQAGTSYPLDGVGVSVFSEYTVRVKLTFITVHYRIVQHTFAKPSETGRGVQARIVT